MEKNASLDDKPLIAKEEKELEEQARIAWRLERCKDPRWFMCNADALGDTALEMQEAHKSNIVKEAIKELQQEQLADSKDK